MRQSRIAAALGLTVLLLWGSTLFLSLPGTAPSSDAVCQVLSWGWNEAEASKVFPLPPLESCQKTRFLLEIEGNQAAIHCQDQETAYFLIPPKQDFRPQGEPLPWQSYRGPVDISEVTYIYALCSDPKGHEVFDAYVHVVLSHTETIGAESYLKDLKEEYGGANPPTKVFVLSLDSVGRNSFLRNFKQTADFLSQSLPGVHTVDFKQLNVVGFQSQENVVPLLTGLNNSEFQRLRDSNEDWEEQSLWQIFKAFGFKALLGLENHVCDYCEFFGYDIHPSRLFFNFYRTATAVENFQPYNSEAHCIGQRNSHTYLLDYMLDYAQAFQDYPVFQYSHIHPGHEPTQRVVKLADEDVKAFLEAVDLRFQEEPFLVVLMADHGHAYHSEAYYAVDDKWAMEYKVPTLFFRYNDLFERHIGSAAVRHNSDHLISPIDLYVTLAHIALANAFPKDSERLRDLSQALAEYNTKSLAFRNLFSQEIPDSRTCSSVGIAPMWCCCLQFIDAMPRQEVLDLLVREMTASLESAPYCERLDIGNLQFFKALLDANVTYYSVEFVPGADSTASFYGIVADHGGKLQVEMMNRLTPYERFCTDIIRIDVFNDIPDRAFCLCSPLNHTSVSTVYSRILPYRYLLDLAIAQANTSCSDACMATRRVCEPGMFTFFNDCDYLADRMDDEHVTSSVLPCVYGNDTAAPYFTAERLVLNEKWSFDCEAKTPKGHRACACVWRG